MRISTLNERRANCGDEADGIYIRRKREWKRGVPSDYDDKPKPFNVKTWKKYRHTQYRGN
jgi:hypothetical protein